MSELIRIFERIEEGDPTAAEQLLPLVYEELRRLASAKLARERNGHTLQPTALVHEAYLRLVDGEPPTRWDSRGHFFAAASEAMRRILVERARRRQTQKHGGQAQRVDLDLHLLAREEKPQEILALDEALGELERHDSQVAALVKLRYFAGLSHQDAAAALGLSRRQADRLWSLARAWLYQRLTDAEGSTR